MSGNSYAHGMKWIEGILQKEQKQYWEKGDICTVPGLTGVQKSGWSVEISVYTAAIWISRNPHSLAKA